MLLLNEPLSRIAVACGFADQPHFCRAIHDVVGLSQNVWRRQNMHLVPAERATRDLLLSAISKASYAAPQSTDRQ